MTTTKTATINLLAKLKEQVQADYHHCMTAICNLEERLVESNGKATTESPQLPQFDLPWKGKKTASADSQLKAMAPVTKAKTKDKTKAKTKAIGTNLERVQAALTGSQWKTNKQLSEETGLTTKQVSLVLANSIYRKQFERMDIPGSNMLKYRLKK